MLETEAGTLWAHLCQQLLSSGSRQSDHTGTWLHSGEIDSLPVSARKTATRKTSRVGWASRAVVCCAGRHAFTQSYSFVVFF